MQSRVAAVDNDALGLTDVSHDSIPFVTVVVPVRNEAALHCESVPCGLRTGLPGDRLEVIVADGMSTDGTRDILAHCRQSIPAWSSSITRAASFRPA